MLSSSSGPLFRGEPSIDRHNLSKLVRQQKLFKRPASAIGGALFGGSPYRGLTHRDAGVLEKVTASAGC
jgi:hypothetical protein